MVLSKWVLPGFSGEFLLADGSGEEVEPAWAAACVAEFVGKFEPMVRAWVEGKQGATAPQQPPRAPLCRLRGTQRLLGRNGRPVCISRASESGSTKNPAEMPEEPAWKGKSVCPLRVAERPRADLQGPPVAKAGGGG